MFARKQKLVLRHTDQKVNIIFLRPISSLEESQKSKNKGENKHQTEFLGRIKDDILIRCCSCCESRRRRLHTCSWERWRGAILIFTFIELSLLKRSIDVPYPHHSVQEAKEPAVEEAEAAPAPWEQSSSSSWSVPILLSPWPGEPPESLTLFWGSYFVLLQSAASAKNTLFQLALDLCFILSTYLTTQHYYE